MDIKKWRPWNWFKREEAEAGRTVPVKREAARDHSRDFAYPIHQFHQEIDRLFDRAFRGFGPGSVGLDRPLIPRPAGGWLKPTLDLGATDGEYTITVEMPGVDRKDINLEIVNDALTIRAEKRQETEEREKNFYRLERSYGTFQRVLSLPEDADQEGVKATFKKGVLAVTLHRKLLPKSGVKQIEVKSA